MCTEGLMLLEKNLYRTKLISYYIFEALQFQDTFFLDFRFKLGISLRSLVTDKQT